METSGPRWAHGEPAVPSHPRTDATSEMRERGLRVGGSALAAEYPCPQGPVWDSVKDALLSLIKYASLPVKL